MTARRLGRVIWIASVPLALTVLLAAPAEHLRAPGAHRGAPHPDATVHLEGGHEEHPIVDNPIENFHDFWTFRDEGKPPPFVAALTNFAVLLFLLFRFAGPSLARFVRERHEAIAKDLAEAARLRDEAQHKLDQYTAKLTGLSDEIGRLVKEIREEAEHDRRRILFEAEARAERLKRDAEQQINAEMLRTKVLLERETVLKAVALAEGLIRERAGPAEQKQLTERFVRGLDPQGAQRA